MGKKLAALKKKLNATRYSPKDKQTAFRFPPALLAAMDEYAENQNESRNQVAIDLIIAGLIGETSTEEKILRAIGHHCDDS